MKGKVITQAYVGPRESPITKQSIGKDGLCHHFLRAKIQSMTKMETRPLREFRKLPPEAKGEVFAYTKWMRDIESREKLREFRTTVQKGKGETKMFRDKLFHGCH